MKRTKEQWNKPQPPADERDQISAAKEFDGEDLSTLSSLFFLRKIPHLLRHIFDFWMSFCHFFLVFFCWNFLFSYDRFPKFAAYDSRRDYFKQQQRLWLEEQVFQKKMQAEAERAEERDYAAQVFAHTRMRYPRWIQRLRHFKIFHHFFENRGMLDDDFSKRKSDIVVSTKANNQQLVKSSSKGWIPYFLLSSGDSRWKNKTRPRTKGGDVWRRSKPKSGCSMSAESKDLILKIFKFPETWNFKKSEVSQSWKKKRVFYLCRSIS